MLKTKYALILDRSGSMLPLKEEAVDGMNAQIGVIRDAMNENHEIRISFSTFSTTWDGFKFYNAHPQEVPLLERKEYIPDGWTALYDAIGEVCSKLNADFGKDADTSFVVVIDTDGQENQSKKYTGAQISSMTKELQATGKWTFVYMGCKADPTLNIPAGNTTATPSKMFGDGDAYSADYLSNAASAKKFLKQRGISGQSATQSWTGGSDQ